MPKQRGKTNEEFIEYLKQVAIDLEESGMTATAKDYREAARRMHFQRALIKRLS